MFPFVHFVSPHIYFMFRFMHLVFPQAYLCSLVFILCSLIFILCVLVFISCSLIVALGSLVFILHSLRFIWCFLLFIFVFPHAYFVLRFIHSAPLQVISCVLSLILGFLLSTSWSPPFPLVRPDIPHEHPDWGVLRSSGVARMVRCQTSVKVCSLESHVDHKLTKCVYAGPRPCARVRRGGGGAERSPQGSCPCSHVANPE